MKRLDVLVPLVVDVAAEDYGERLMRQLDKPYLKYGSSVPRQSSKAERRGDRDKSLDPYARN